MKILVFSDSHRYANCMINAIELESPELILHLGDLESDCSEVKTRYPEIPFRSVKGNCDPWSNGKDVCEFTVCGKHIFMTHGHLHGVKKGIGSLVRAAEDRGADILLYGHTHIPFCDIGKELSIINPGSIGAATRVFAVLEISDDGAIDCTFKETGF